MYFLKKIFNDTAIFFKLHAIKKAKKYRIIPVGTYCLPRTITTIAGIKPRKKDGEKSLPFDLAFFLDFDKIIELIDSNFEHFYDALEYNEESKYWENKDITAIFNHETNLTKEEFIKRYNNRINNLYEYLSDKTFHAFILIASMNAITFKQIKNLRNLILKYRNDKEFDIIIINQSKEAVTCNEKNVHIIDQHENYDVFNEMNENGGWARNLKKRKTKTAQKIYYEIIYGILNIIK